MERKMRLLCGACFAFLLPAASAAGRSASEPAPPWVSALALRAVQETQSSDFTAEDLRMYRTWNVTPYEANMVQYTLSPDGKAVLLRTRGRGKNSEILWIGREGESPARRLFECRWGMSGPRWSPGGDKAAFILRLTSIIDLTLVLRPEDDMKAYTLVVADLESGATREVSPRWYSAKSIIHPIDWSPDGRSIAFTASMVPMSKDRNTLELYLADVTAATPSITQLTENDVSDTSPVFSPEGDRIAFQRRVPQHGYNQLRIFDLVARSEERIAGGERRERGGWHLSAGGAEWWLYGNGLTFWGAYPNGPPPLHFHYSYNLVPGASEVIETRN
jgi:dipeptidyl aminopeptidase/acylaminoacyl peptidase